MERLLEGYRKLGTHIAAAGYAGVAPSTVRGWIAEDEDLSREVDFARADYCVRHATALEEVNTPERHEKALQVVARSEYMPVNRTELTGKDGAALAPFTMNDAPATTPAQEAKP